MQRSIHSVSGTVGPQTRTSETGKHGHKHRPSRNLTSQWKFKYPSAFCPTKNDKTCLWFQDVSLSENPLARLMHSMATPALVTPMALWFAEHRSMSAASQVIQVLVVKQSSLRSIIFHHTSHTRTLHNFTVTNAILKFNAIPFWIYPLAI